MRKYRSKREIAEELARTVAEQPGGDAAAGQFSRESIEKLAYQYWVNRGCPTGSAEEDWFEAERALLRAAQMDRVSEVHTSLSGAVMRAGG